MGFFPKISKSASQDQNSRACAASNYILKVLRRKQRKIGYNLL